MSYTALYRKWRPVSFEDVKGQDPIVQTLKNQITSERIGHAYLFCGTRGTGKTSIAKIYARAVNCEHPVDGSPCNQCPSCKSILAGTSMNVVEIDAASNNGVENIRDIREQVQYPPTEGKYRVYIIDEVHMLSIGAFNALLKTLEEPPSYVIFILATTEVHKIPITILSRCQRYDFKRISLETIAGRLRQLTEAEHIEVEDKALMYVAKAADGSLRDALSLLDQCVAFHYGKLLTYENVLDVLGAVDSGVFSSMFNAVIEGRTKDCITQLEEIVIQGRELGQFVTDFIWYLRNLLLVQSADDAEGLLDMSEENLKQLKEDSTKTDGNTLMRYIRIFSELSNQIRYASQKRVLVEIALIKLCQPVMETNLDSLFDRIRVLEEKMEKGIPVLTESQKASTRALPQPELFGEEPQEQEAVKPQKAAPQDLQYIQKNWTAIVRETSGLLKQMLKEATPKYNANSDEPILYIEFHNFQAEICTKNPDTIPLLKKIIREKTGKEVEIQFVITDTDLKGPAGLTPISVDELIEQSIQMDVVVEDMSDDEEDI